MDQAPVRYYNDPMDRAVDIHGRMADCGFAPPRAEVRADMARILDYWRAMPANKPRTSLDPARLGARALSRIALLRTLIDDPDTPVVAREDPGPTLDFRYELVGDLVLSYAPRLKPGSRSSGIVAIDPERTFVLEAQRRAARDRRPLGMLLNYRDIEELERTCYSFALPLDCREQLAHGLLIGIWAEVPALRPGDRAQGLLLDDVDGWLHDMVAPRAH